MNDIAGESHQNEESVQVQVDSVIEFEVFFARLREAIGTDDLYGWGKAHGFARQTLYNMVSAQKVPGLETLRRFREETGKPIGWLLGEDVFAAASAQVEERSDEFVFIPRAAAKENEPSISMAFRRYWVEKYLKANPDHLTVCRIDDDAMEGTFNLSDNVLVHSKAVEPVRDGLYGLLINGVLVIRRVQVLPGNRIRVMPDNPKYPSFEVELAEDCGVEFVGVPVWYSRMI
jgi:hypothetical protein